MQKDAVAEFYGAWNQRDPGALARTFVDDGTFADPLCRSAVSGDALRAHVAAVAAALPASTSRSHARSAARTMSRSLGL